MPARLDAGGLRAVAAAAGAQVSARSLELWRRRGLLPRPERAGGGRGVWLYPARSDKQLLRLLHWRRRTRYLDEVAVALWVEGYPVDLELVREGLARFLERWEAMIEVELGRSPGSEEATLIDAVARKLARMRGKAGLPRVSRMTLGDRERACGYLAAAIFGSEAELRRREADLPQVERLLGLRRGHDGGLTALLGLRDGDGQVARLPTPAEGGAALAGARAQELALARSVLQLFLYVLPAVLPFLFAEQAAKAVGVVEFAEEAFSEPPAGLLPFLLIVLLVSIVAKEASLEELAEQMGTLDPMRAGPELRDLLAAGRGGQISVADPAPPG